MYEDEATCSQT
ncbi:hypothetical protein ECPA31_2892, partial [Escherichia coli PA31]